MTLELIQALAASIGAPERGVGLVTRESLGIRDVDPGDDGAAASIARDPALTERARRVLLADVREKQRGQVAEQQQDASSERADAPAECGGVGRDTEPVRITAGEAGELPWARDDFYLAAKRGRDQGPEARQRQAIEWEAGRA